MSKKKLFMIIIVAVICVAALSVALVMVRGKKHNKPTNNVKKTYQIVKIDEKVGLGGFLWI